MVSENRQNIPVPGGGCRQWPPAVDETGLRPRRPEAGMAGGRENWIYGEPVVEADQSRPAALSGVAAADPPAEGKGTAEPIPGEGDGASFPLPGMNGGGVIGGRHSSAAQGERMRNPVPMEATHTPGNAKEAYQSSLRCLLDRNIGYFVVATFLIGTGQSITWQGILHSVGSDYLVLYQPDYGRYISCDLYSLKFAQFHNVKGVPYCAGSQSWQGQTAY